jgi:hypothetical protein
MAEDHSLPGWPKKKLVKDVRRDLGRYGIRPIRIDIWRATWAWAEAIARSYWHMHWPQAWEIGTQYILLLLMEMKENRSLRLPYRASDHIPPEVVALLPLSQPVPPIHGIAPRFRVVLKDNSAYHQLVHRFFGDELLALSQLADSAATDTDEDYEG